MNKYEIERQRADDRMTRIAAWIIAGLFVAAYIGAHVMWAMQGWVH